MGSERTCSACATAFVDEATQCRRCGWDGARVRRRCVTCGGLVCAQFDAAKLKVSGVVTACVVAGTGWLFGFLGSLAVLCAAAAAGSMIMRATFRQRCGDCGALPLERFLSLGERREIEDGRARFSIRAGLFAVASVGAALLWLAVARVGHGSDDSDGQASAAASAPAVASVDVAALGASGDVD